MTNDDFPFRAEPLKMNAQRRGQRIFHADLEVLVHLDLLPLVDECALDLSSRRQSRLA